MRKQNRYMPRYYPINLVLENKKCVVVGAGFVAERKVRRLLECGALVSVIGLECTCGIKALAKKRKINLKNSSFNLKDLSGAYLVIAATSDRLLNSKVSSFCRKKGILINVVDSPLDCNFMLPSLVNRGDLTISISTEGISPTLAKNIRQELELVFGPEYAKLLRLMKDFRFIAQDKIKNSRLRKQFFQDSISKEILRLLKNNKEPEAKRKILACLKRYSNTNV